MNNPLEQLIQRHDVRPNNPFIKFDKKDVELSVPERFQKQVDMYPEQIAVRAGEYSFTYDALNKLANRIARAILTKGNLKAEPIAILFESSAPIIAAMLGVLKAGNFYVPLATSQQKSRITYIMEDTQARIMQTER